MLWIIDRCQISERLQFTNNKLSVMRGNMQSHGGKGRGGGIGGRRTRLHPRLGSLAEGHQTLRTTSVKQGQSPLSFQCGKTKNIWREG